MDTGGKKQETKIDPEANKSTLSVALGAGQSDRLFHMKLAMEKKRVSIYYFIPSHISPFISVVYCLMSSVRYVVFMLKVLANNNNVLLSSVHHSANFYSSENLKFVQVE